MTALKYGSKGSSVAELQSLLNATGLYTLATDGIYGKLTEQAVRDYQARSGLAIDGIAGVNTWGSLQSGTTAATEAAAAQMNGTTAPTATDYSANRPAYEQSQSVIDSASELAAAKASAPGEYTSEYGDQIQVLIDAALNRPAFTYDPSTDPLYQQYSDMYQQTGKRAMQDAMGNAAALTGGYGNSYAQMAGQQAYQGQLQEMNGIIPELQQAAYEMYANQGNEMRNNLATLQGQEEQAYGRYRDEVGDYNNNLGMLQGIYDTENERDYGRYRDTVGDYENDQSYAYQQAQDAIAQQQWNSEYNLAVAQAAKKTSSGGSSKSSGNSFLDSLANNPNLTDAQRTAMANAYYGITEPTISEEELKKNALKQSQSLGYSVGR